MDNVCHTLVGAAAAEAGLKRHTRFGALALLVSANLPDLDVLVFATGTPSVAFRRGWTHGIVAQLALPVLLAGVLWAIGRRRADDGARLEARFVPLLLLSLVGVYSHVFLDYLNNYGVRLLAPLDWRWFYGDAVFIVDPFLWITLAAGVWMTRRTRSPRASAVALLVATVYIAGMLVSAGAARGLVEARWAETHGAAPRALMVGPRFAFPFSRDVIVDAGGHYEWGTFRWPSSLVLSGERIPKNDDRPAVAAARAAPGVRGFLVWSRFPFWTLEPSTGGTKVSVFDARFIRRGPFTASTIVPAPGAPGVRPLESSRVRGSDPMSRSVSGLDRDTQRSP